MPRLPQVYIFSRFLRRAARGTKKQAMVFGRVMAAPRPGERFELITKDASGARVLFARGVCAERFKAEFVLDDDGGGRIGCDGGVIADPAMLDVFAQREGFDDWAQLRAFHVTAGRLSFAAYIVSWDHLEFTVSTAALEHTRVGEAA